MKNKITHNICSVLTNVTTQKQLIFDNFEFLGTIVCQQHKASSKRLLSALETFYSSFIHINIWPNSNNYSSSN